MVLLGGPQGQHSDEFVSVDYAVASGTAQAGTDYVAGDTPLTGRLVFAPGETVKTVSVDLVDDTSPEGLERFFLNLSNAEEATILDGRAVAEIGASDVRRAGSPVLSVGDQVVGEGDGYVDDFDVFLKHYDANGDGKLVLSSSLIAGTPASALTPEFTADDDLARLVDSGLPDRNKNGVSGWQDSNRNGRWDSGENLNDFDAASGTYPDRVLGWRDGVIDRKDQYAKVRGRLFYRTTQAAWETGQAHDYQSIVNGAIRPPTAA